MFELLYDLPLVMPIESLQTINNAQQDTNAQYFQVIKMITLQF